LQIIISITLVTQEAKIMKMVFQGQLGEKKVPETSCQIIKATCEPDNPSKSGSWDQEDYGPRQTQVNSLCNLITKVTRPKWAGDMTQAAPVLHVWSPRFKPQSQLKERKGKKKKKLSVVAHACYPSYMRRINQRTGVQTSLGINTKSYLKIIKK
jgi:hypothetical protein